MIKVDQIHISGILSAVRGMRNPMNSHALSDTVGSEIGPNDLKLMMQLSEAGSDHAKYLRMMVVYMDITAPMYWWKEFDTYKVGTVRNSSSTMHKIHSKKFTADDFSCEHLNKETMHMLNQVIQYLNISRYCYNSAIAENETEKAKVYWWQMIQLLPSSYNQTATVMLNYQVLKNIYHSRKHHKLDEWRHFCDVIEALPYSALITGGHN